MFVSGWIPRFNECVNPRNGLLLCKYQSMLRMVTLYYFFSNNFFVLSQVFDVVMVQY